MMRIDGVTKRQKELLDIMWGIDTQEEVIEWANTLTETDYNIVRGLLELVKYQLLDDVFEIENNLTDANDLITRVKAK